MPLGPAVRRLAARVDPEPDAALVRRFLAGRDEAAFAELVGRYGGLVQGVCRRALGHAHDAEDAAQAVFLVLARSAGRLRNESSVAAWLHGVAVRVCRKALARRAKRPPVPPAPVASPPADEAVAWQDARRAIDDALAALPDALRRPLVLCYLQGLTRDEASSRLGWSLSTFRGRLERGRDRLRAELVRRGFPLAVGLLAVPLSDANADPGWAAAVARAVTGPVPESVSLLARGVAPAMHRWLYLVPALGLAAGLVWAADTASKPTPPPKPPATLLKPDPKAKPTAADLKGYWAAEQIPPARDTRRDHAWRFVDGRHLVWVLTQAGEGFRASVTTKFRYELADGTLTLHTVEKWAGEEKLARRKDDDKPRVYAFAWDQDRAGFTVTATEAAPDSPWRTMVFRKADEPKDTPDPLVPESLTKIDRTIKKEPEYGDTPHYLLAVIGPEATFKVWVVLAGAALYVDRNGNGDLTDAGEALPLGTIPGVPADLQRPSYVVGDLSDPAGPKHTDFVFGGVRTPGGNVFPRLGMRVGGKAVQMAGPTDLRMGESPKDAPVLHFGSKVVTVRPSKTMPSTPDAGKPGDYRVQVGTPGVGPGSFVSWGNDGLADGVGPVAEFLFTPAKAGDAPLAVKRALTDRCCGDQFYEKLAVPAGAKAGLDAARVTLSFPDCPWGRVAPAHYPLDVIPARK